MTTDTGGGYWGAAAQMAADRRAHEEQMGALRRAHQEWIEREHAAFGRLLTECNDRLLAERNARLDRAWERSERALVAGFVLLVVSQILVLAINLRCDSLILRLTGIVAPGCPPL